MTVRRKVFNVDYDSYLGYPDQYNRTPFQLTLKVHLTRMVPPKNHTYGTIHDNAGKKDIKYQAWTDADWETYKSDLKSEVEKQLNWPRLQLYLLPQIRGREKMSKIQFMYFQNKSPKQNKNTPYVVCGVWIDLVDDKSKAHVAFQVLREKTGEPDFRSYDAQVVGGQDYGTLTEREVSRWATPNSEIDPRYGTQQNTAAHELAHVLGLDHINSKDPGCKDPGDLICYGKPGTDDFWNLMGHGNRITPANSPPWVKRIPLHAQGLSWSVNTKRPDEIDI